MKCLSGKKETVSVRKAKEAGWVQVFRGSDSLVNAVGLLPNCIYQFRATCQNLEGVSSPPSDVTNGATLESKFSVRAANAPEVFTVECTGDVVTGDLVLFTERVYVRDGKAVAAPKDGLGGGKRGSGGTPRVTPRSGGGASLTSVDSRGGERVARSERRKERSDDAPCEGERSETSSEYSILNTDASPTPRFLLSGFGSSSRSGLFGGERTVAGLVLSVRSSPSGRRYFRMLVSWSSVSDKSLRGVATLGEGAVVEREEGEVFRFETFRRKWEEEERRK